jgi:preprotein translocase subunit YajC
MESYTYIIYFVVIIAVFYFLMIRPEKKRKKKLQDMRSSIEVGSEITTIGGMVGKVVSMDNDFVTFETGEDRVRIQIAKWGISTSGKAAQQQ